MGGNPYNSILRGQLRAYAYALARSLECIHIFIVIYACRKGEKSNSLLITHITLDQLGLSPLLSGLSIMSLFVTLFAKEGSVF